MLLQGTHDEIAYFNIMCQKLPDCTGCPLNKWCQRRIYRHGNPSNEDTVSELIVKVKGKKYGPGYHTMLIRKDDNEEP